MVIRKSKNLYIVKECTDLNVLNQISSVFEELAIDLIFKAAVFLVNDTGL